MIRKDPQLRPSIDEILSNSIFSEKIKRLLTAEIPMKLPKEVKLSWNTDFLPQLHPKPHKNSIDSDKLLDSETGTTSRANSVSRWSKKTSDHSSNKPYESTKLKSRFAVRQRTDSKDKTESSLTHSRVDSSSVASDKGSAVTRLSGKAAQTKVFPSKFKPNSIKNAQLVRTFGNHIVHNML